MVRSNTYHPRLNLITPRGYKKEKNEESAASHEYDYDVLMRPLRRRDFWDQDTPVTTRDFSYNTRSELLEDQIRQEGNFTYSYDNIGNRKTACYASRGFIPFLGLPEGGCDIVRNMLLNDYQ